MVRQVTEQSPVETDEEPVQSHRIVMGFVLESESMPDDSGDTLYTLTHPDLPGLAYSGSNPWECLLEGIQAAERIMRRRMESGEKFSLES